MINRIETGLRVANKPEASFVAITTEAPLWQHYDQIPKELRDTPVPMMICLMRWDGQIGLIGGNMDEGETPLWAAKREACEELGVSPDLQEKGEWVPVCSHEMENLVTHLWSWKVDFEIFKRLLKEQGRAEHYITEGHAMSVQCRDYDKMLSFSHFKKQHFAPSVKEQLAELLPFLGWDKSYGSQMEPSDRAPYEESKKELNPKFGEQDTYSIRRFKN